VALFAAWLLLLRLDPYGAPVPAADRARV
jgi:hypothetical protein